MGPCWEVAFHLSSVLYFGDLNSTLVIHLKLSTSISKLALLVFRISYQTETQPRLKLLSVCVLSRLQCAKTPVQHTALSNSICRAFLQSLLACESIFFLAPFFFSLLCLRPQLSKGKENCPQCSETHAFFVCMVYSNVFMPNEWNIVNVYCIKIKVCNLAVIIQWVTDIIRTSI